MKEYVQTVIPEAWLDSYLASEWEELSRKDGQVTVRRKIIKEGHN